MKQLKFPKNISLHEKKRESRKNLPTETKMQKKPLAHYMEILDKTYGSVI